MQNTRSIKKQEIIKKWYCIDATNVRFGKLSVKCAEILMGKNKINNADYLDVSDSIVVINIDKMDVSKKKLEKKYYTHSGYPGGIKEKTLETLLKAKPEYLLRRSVWGMLPKNKMSRHVLTNLHVVAGEKHKFEAQTPEMIKVN